MCNNLQYVINDFQISKNNILDEYTQISDYIKKCIRALYGESQNGIDLYNFNPQNIIRENTTYNTSQLSCIIGKTGVYVFIKDRIPVYIGIGGEKHNSSTDLRERVWQEMKVFKKEDQTVKYTISSGATLSKNIQDIDRILMNHPVSPNESIEEIKTFSITVINVGCISSIDNVDKAQCLEKALIALFHPKYNK